MKNIFLKKNNRAISKNIYIKLEGIGYWIDQYLNSNVY